MTGGKKIGAIRRGFTVMEGLVVLAVFSILVVSFTEIFVRTSRGSLETAQRVLIESDARTILESIARAVRVSNIDYAAYGGVLPASGGGSNPVALNELDLANPDGNVSYRIKRNDSDVGCWGDGLSYPCIIVSTDAGVTWSPLSPRNSKITRLVFAASPGVDPYSFNSGTGTYAAQNVPLVTINLSMQGFALFNNSSWTYNVQTSVTPRYYKR